MNTSQQRVAIVTGASRGIGAAVARQLAVDGFAVAVNYAGSADAAAKLVTEIESTGNRAIAAQADVSDPRAVQRLFDSAERAFGGVDVLVNNAGIMKLARPRSRRQFWKSSTHLSANGPSGWSSTLQATARRSPSP
jgi:3-oxoacyl-[acyl-carrier protein] reductase